MVITITSIFIVNSILLLTLLSFGEIIQRLLKVNTSSLLERIVLSLSIGTSVIPLLSLVLTLFKAFVTPVVTLITCILIVSSLLSLRRISLNKISFLRNNCSLLLPSIILVSWILRFIPTIGMCVHPGDDPKMHALLAKLIVDNCGYPHSWGRYSLSGLEDVPITYQMGFHSLIAFTHLLSLERIPITHVTFLVSQFYNWVLTFSFYPFICSFFGSRKAAVISIVLSSVFPYPLITVGYGGNARLPALLILLVSMPLVKNARFNARHVMLLTLLVMGLSTIHIGVLILFFLLSLPIVLNYLIKGKFEHLVWILLPFLLITLTKREVIECFLYSKASFTEKFSIEWWVYDFSHIVKTFNETLKLLFISPIHSFYFTIILIDGCFFIALLKSGRRRESLYLIYWITLLVLLLLNNPIGPYFFCFPGWFIFIPGVLVEWLFIVHLVAISLILSEVLQKGRVLRLLGISFLAFLTLFCLANDIWYISWVRENGDPITMADLKAFEWIKTNLPKESTFLVTDCDAGQYIPIFCERRAIPIFLNFQGELILNETAWNDVFIISGFHEGKVYKLLQTAPDSTETLQLLKKYDIEYIYVGSKRIYARRFEWDLVEGSPKFKKIYEDDGVRIYEVIHGS